MLRALLTAAVVAAVVVVPAGAVTTNGFPDNGQHPNVGAIVVPSNGGYAEVCSGNGDSGGPTFLGGAPNDGDVVLAVTSTGDTPCYSTNVASRTDTPSARAFLSTFGL
jgi:secreted trypsin-like serine protease